MVQETLVVGNRGLITGDIPFEPCVRNGDARQAPLVLAIFLAVQFLDGVLTYWGVTRFGLEVELNTLLASSMAAIGPAATLVAAKGLACACGAILYVHAYYRPLAAVSGLCLGLAVVPWVVFWVSTFSV